MSDETLIFLHVPRTSGSTLQGIMLRQYRPDEVHSAELLLPSEFEVFAALPDEQRAGIRLLKGHMAFGLHRYLPRRARYFTMIRDPLERVVSFYYYIRRRPTDPLYPQVMENDIDLATFVESGMARDHTDNSFVRFISGDMSVDTGAVGDNLLERAKANVRDHFFLTGSMENFDETLLMLKHEFDWYAPVYYRRQNVTAGRPALSSLDDRTRSVLERHTEVDRELVDYCRRRFEEQRAAMSPDFDAEVRNFKRRNFVFDKTYPILQVLRRRFGRSRSN